MRLVAAACLFGGATIASATDAIVIEVGAIRSGGIVVRDVAVRLDLVSDTKLQAEVRAARATLPDPIGTLTNVRLTCAGPVIAEPRFGCTRGTFAARGGPTGAISGNLHGEFRTDTGAAEGHLQGLRIAGAKLDVRAASDRAGWRVNGQAHGATLAQLRSFAKPWYEVPADLTIDGRLDLDFAAAGTGSRLRDGSLLAKLASLNFTNEAGTAVAENVSAELRAELKHGVASDAVTATLTSAAGQALAGPILLDLGANPLAIDVVGTLQDRVIAVSRLSVTQRKLLSALGTGSIDLRGATPLVAAQLALESLEFPAAYTSYLQIALASTDFGNLDISGKVNGRIEVANNLPSRLQLELVDVDLADRKGKIRMSDVEGTLHWVPDGQADVPTSVIRWSAGGAYGLSGGAAELSLRARANNVELTKPARVPVFDGAIAIDQLELKNVGTDALEILFEAQLDPISMPLLCKAFGWPEFAGVISGRIPNLTYRDKLLKVGGDVEARVFGGRIVGSNLRLQDPFGSWPRMFADVRARNLDLAQVTNTFAIGSITGKLEADVLGLELFAWSPVAFNARLETPRGDRSPKRISAKAVGNLSNIGGGGGSVMQALQSGLLKFFDDYSYDRLGLTCQLRDNVCVMSGVEPAGVGYYIVKGSGVPRIDIIGNSGRVDWRQLVTQVSTAINTRSEDVEVK